MYSTIRFGTASKVAPQGGHLKGTFIARGQGPQEEELDQAVVHPGRCAGRPAGLAGCSLMQTEGLGLVYVPTSQCDAPGPDSRRLSQGKDGLGREERSSARHSSRRAG
jgi:hypothetical protein